MLALKTSPQEGFLEDYFTDLVVVVDDDDARTEGGFGHACEDHRRDGVLFLVESEPPSVRSKSVSTSPEMMMEGIVGELFKGVTLMQPAVPRSGLAPCKFISGC